MTANADFWDFYWENRLLAFENLGKREAILAGSRLIRQMSENTSISLEKNGAALRVLELGCGEGQVIGTLLDAHAQSVNLRLSTGIDYNERSLAQARKLLPAMRWVAGDFTDPALLANLGKFDLVMLVNALHEVFSTTVAPDSGEVNVTAAKGRAAQTLKIAADCLAPGGWLLLFDGLEPPGDPDQTIRIRFLDGEARKEFDLFASEYRPFHITFKEVGGPSTIELSQHDFVRYITKSIFISKHLWRTERFESYQYFTEEEFRAAFAAAGLKIASLRTLTVNESKWRHRVELQRGSLFPQEHILILAQV